MINKIDIASFGSFSGFIWKKSIKDVGFKRLNILYGRNYSGKTTLSRIFRALETRHIPPNYDTPSFTVYGDKGNITQASIDAHSYDVRVYNRDFVHDNLSFLVNPISGEIKTFAIVGEKNKKIEDEIAAIEAELGSLEKQMGFRFDLEGKKKERDQANGNEKTASDSLDDKLRTHANEKIKMNREYGDPLYNIDRIKGDIDATKNGGFNCLPKKRSL